MYILRAGNSLIDLFSSGVCFVLFRSRVIPSYKSTRLLESLAVGTFESKNLNIIVHKTFDEHGYDMAQDYHQPWSLFAAQTASKARLPGAIFSATCIATALRHRLQEGLHGATKLLPKVETNTSFCNNCCNLTRNKIAISNCTVRDTPQYSIAPVIPLAYIYGLLNTIKWCVRKVGSLHEHAV